MLTRLRKAIYRARGAYRGRLGGVPFRLDPYHSKFWRRAGAGRWEPETFAVLDAHLAADRDYLDIGAWIGPTVLYAAKKARHVWAFEPDATAFRHLAWNIELNGLANVSALPVALAARTGVARMASFGGEPGDSMTSLLKGAEAGGSDVVTLDWRAFAGDVDLSGVGLVKMDVEGAEFDLIPELLPWLQAVRPALYLSTHAPYLNEGERAARMGRLFDQLSFYGQCRDGDGAPVTAATFTAAAALTRFPTFLFTE
ncbi:FkbM family methyltransferase [Pseudodonghicola flavimaris]|uniref:FkbM family methyltransferase n=1 Tax=Pseudodonghicola flavimaris TaxID=3050036 RepID=A0ABT7F7C8_9RHOB|nr:FkbM family methyltransferase [Pseudodonghicola flavimaris]MDK3020524.1 FkbM family methyltransferase [Pseudodonghicola flavimaris]